MSDLPSHGTTWAESEAFMDVFTLFDQWQDGGPAPDFTTIRRRLHESFTLNELRNLEVVAQTFSALINVELATRGSESDYMHPADPTH